MLNQELSGRQIVRLHGPMEGRGTVDLRCINIGLSRQKRAYGRFVRSFVLPDGADAEKVNAEFKDGVLKVHLPKSEKTKPKQIEVKVA